MRRFGSSSVCALAKTLRVSHSVVRVKICGLTCVDDALALRRGRRRLDRAQFSSGLAAIRRSRLVAAEIIAALPASVSAVGVFVDRPAAEVAEVAERLGLEIVQLHGQEPPEDLLVARPSPDHPGIPA